MINNIKDSEPIEESKESELQDLKEDYEKYFIYKLRYNRIY